MFFPAVGSNVNYNSLYTPLGREIVVTLSLVLEACV